MAILGTFSSVRNASTKTIPSDPRVVRLPLRPVLQRLFAQTSESSLALFRNAQAHATNTAVVNDGGQKFTYAQLLADAKAIAGSLQKRLALADLEGSRVAFLAPPTYEYVAMQWAVWMSGGVAVPLSPHHTKLELSYFVSDSRSSLLLVHPSLSENAKNLEVPIDVVELPPMSSLAPATQLPRIESSRDAMIIYTSGTTGKPKGVVSTHSNVESQVKTLVDAWEWRPTDVTYNVLPLHHVHGIINVVTCALYSGACVEMPSKFDARAVLDRFLQGGLTVFMAVPTVYSRLLQEIAKLPSERQMELRAAMSKLRLMVSGSAALPIPVLERWREASGHTLLERYGMTELGMALSNPLHGTRIPGRVGEPLPGVQVRLADAEIANNQTVGELRVRGPSVFSRYWDRPEATRDSFDADGFFKTGDIAALDLKTNSYQILGRASVDIIKSGGYKISALEIEPVILAHKAVRECAVVGLPDDQWGERIFAVIALHPGHTLTLDDLRAHCKKELSNYKLPSGMQLVPSIPRNTLGKVNKKELVKTLLHSK